jgi:hypothetical protein
MMPPGLLEWPLRIAETKGFTTELATLIELYAHLSRLQTHIFANSSTKAQFIAPFTQISTAIECRLLSLANPRPQDPTSFPSSAAHTTLTICAFVIFKNFSPSSPALKVLQARLIPTLTNLQTLHVSTESILSPQELNMILWILWVGALTAEEEDWYVPRIIGLIMALGINEWAELKVVLEYFVWNARMENKACWELCDRVGVSRGFETRAELV